MRLRRPSIDRTFLESRVARRVFGVVAACSLVPVVAFAFFSYGQVRGQLERDAARALRVSSKSAGMALMQRLLLAEEALRIQVRGASADSGSAPTAGDLARPLRSVRVLTQSALEGLGLDRQSITRLDEGRTVLLVDAVDRTSRVRLVFRGATTEALARVAEVDGRYLFAGSADVGGNRVWVTQMDGVVLSGELPDWEPPGFDWRLGVPSGPVDIAGQPSLVGQREIFLAGAFGAAPWILGVSRPLAEVHRPLREFEAVFPWVVGITLCFALGLSLRQIRHTLVPIAELTRGAKRVAVGDYDTRVEVLTRDEFGYLSEAFNEMAEVIGRQVRVLATVNAIGTALSAEDDTDRLIDLIVRGSMQVTQANGAALFLASDVGELELSRMRMRGERIVAGASAGQEPLQEVARRCLERRAVLRVRDLSEVTEEERAHWDVLSRDLEKPVVGYLAVPLSDENANPLGVLLLVRCGFGRFSDEDASLAASLASQAAVAIRKNGLVESFRGLFEGLIQLTVKAIDKKSAYTGDHCRNVPIITEMIANAACSDRVGGLKDFDMTQDERYELRIAALLHDCGKVVTPVHVMEKSTKLETIFDRFALVETRFEVLRRDARIRALTRRLAVAGALLEEGDDTELAADLRELDDDLDFLRSRNIGAERTAEEDRDRVRRIARRYGWTTASGRDRGCLEPDEVENLTIVRGTLNDAERAIIQDHVVATMSMLEELPFPPGLRQVPAIAGAHHERVDGRGYPLQLRGDQLSVQARILCLADVFEALTAKDRPYKAGMTLSKTLGILESMSEEGHIDPQIYELFLRDEIHLHYAANHMSPEQIDPEFHADLERLTGP